MNDTEQRASGGFKSPRASGSCIHEMCTQEATCSVDIEHRTSYVRY